MNTKNGDRQPDAAEPLDDRDFAILDGVRDVYELMDPMPPDLLDNIRFAVAAQHLEIEIARVSSELLTVVTRGEDSQRLITFECPNMSIIVAIRINDDGTARLDGWLTPRGVHAVELRTPAGIVATEADEQGRFVLEALPRTTGYLTVRIAGPQSAVRTVTTPTIKV